MVLPLVGQQWPISLTFGFVIFSVLSFAFCSHQRSFAVFCTDSVCSNKLIDFDRSPCRIDEHNNRLNYFVLNCDTLTKRSESQKSIEDVLSNFEHNAYHELLPLIRQKRDLSTSYSDPLFKEQWYFNEEGYGGYDLNVKAAWAKGYTGKGVVVSILDDGIQTDHPDLEANYDKDASTDINDKDNDPMPRDNGDNKHGTRCAGEVAAMANNEYCGVGVAYNARIGGVRMLDGSVNDNVESAALGFNSDYIDIYSASWGPEDDGKTVDGPGPLARRQFITGVTHGRKGKGSIFIWASGNGGRHNDSCNCDGYTNSIFTLSVSSATQAGYKPWYLEECASTLTTTYSSGTPGHDKSVTTVDMDGRLRSDHICTVEHTGTSASAPLAAGCAALALEANPQLTWRDMQYLVVLTSRAEPLLAETGWFKNGVGRYFSHKFGYGLIDAGKMVELAEKWIPVPAQHICKSSEVFPERKIEAVPYSSMELSMFVNGCSNSLNEVLYLEHVQCKITLRFFPRGNLRIVLTSPSGTNSTLLFERGRDVISSNFDDWPFMSVHFWGEKPHGQWRLQIFNSGNRHVNKNGILHKWQLIFYGTNTNPIRLKKQTNPIDSFDPFKQSSSSGTFRFPHYPFGDFGSQYSFDNIFAGSNVHESIVKSQHLQYRTKNIRKCPSNSQLPKPENCVESCPNGTFEQPDGNCSPCHDSCSRCTGPYQKDCLACSSAFFILDDLKICMQHCPDGYFEDVKRKICIPCTSNCAACPQNPETCTRCHFNLLNYNHKCLGSCPIGTYETDDNKCKPCHNTCRTCFGPNETQCYSCDPDTYEYKNRCRPSCPPQTYANDDTLECYNCPVGCSKCVNAVDCYECDRNWIFFNSTKCVPKTFDLCKNDEFSDPKNGSCQKCHPSCKSCSLANNNSCLSCEYPLLLQRSQCVRKCSAGFYWNEAESVCESCPHLCTKCSSSNVCSECKQSLVLQDNRCLTACSNGFYSDRNVCSRCDDSCETCSGPQVDQCISCANETYFVNGKCVVKCPKGFYFNRFDSIMKCLKCDKLNSDCDKEAIANAKDDLYFDEIINGDKNGDNEQQHNEIVIKKETIKPEQKLQLKQVAFNEFPFINHHSYLLLVIVGFIILLIPTIFLMFRKHNSSGRNRSKSLQASYQIVHDCDDNDSDTDEHFANPKIQSC